MIMAQKLNPEHREKFGDDLERYVQTAAIKIMEKMVWYDGCDDTDLVERRGFRNLHKTVSEILMENIYIPLTMGEDKL